MTYPCQKNRQQFRSDLVRAAREVGGQQLAEQVFRLICQSQIDERVNAAGEILDGNL